MAKANTAEVDATVDAAFTAGFGGAPPEVIPPVKVVEEPKVEPAKPVAAVVPPVVVEKPEYIRLTKKDWDNTKAAANKVASLESQVAKLTGSMPKAEQMIQQVLDKVKADTPAGQVVEITDEDVAELAADFPDVAANLKKSLQKVAGKLRGTGPAQAPAAMDEGAVTKAVEAVLTGREKQALEKAHPTWREIVGVVDMSKGEKPPEDNAFRKWAMALPAEEQTELNETHSPMVVKEFIDRFIAQAKVAPATPAPKPDKAASRRAVIEDAVTPKADGTPPPLNQPTSAQDAFVSGFKTVKSH